MSGRYARGGRATVTIRGKQAGRDVQFAVPVALPERADAHPAIATVWARERIAELSRRLVRRADPELERQIIALSIASHVLTQLTAFVAVDRSRVTAGGKPVRVAVPVEVPDAVAGIAAGGYGTMSGYGIGGGGTGWGTIGVGHYGVIGKASGTSVGYGDGGAGTLAMRGAVATIPEVAIGAPVAAGSLDKAIIRRYIRRHLAQIQYCYERRLLARRALAGTIATHFTISGAGRVIAATADGMGDAEVEACVAGVVKAIEFPAPDGGGVVQVNYPFAFHPAREPSR